MSSFPAQGSLACLSPASRLCGCSQSRGTGHQGQHYWAPRPAFPLFAGTMEFHLMRASPLTHDLSS